MTDISISPDLWAGVMLPEGILEHWRVADGTVVSQGDVVAEVRIEDALHELVAPAGGRVIKLAKLNAIIEPGAVIGRIG